MKNRFINRGEDHQRFSLRKLTIGVASVLLGTTFMVFGTQTAQADSNVSNQVKTEEVVQSKVDNLPQADEVKATNEVKNTNNEVSSKSDEVAETETTNTKTELVQTTTNNSTNFQNKEAVTDNSAKVETKNKVNDSSDLTNSSDSNSKASDAISQKDALALLGFNGRELSDEQLAKLGITKDTYVKDGIKYRATGSITIHDMDGDSSKVDGIVPLHHKDGSMYSNEELVSNIDWDYALDHEIEGADADYKYAPVAQGGVIYINKGHTLTSQDAYRGLPTNIDKAYQSVDWDKNIGNQVDINKVGTYDAAVAVVYKSELGQSVGVKVVVVDLQGKEITTHIGADVPAADTSVDGQPSGAKATWTDQPSTDKAGDSKGTVEVIYPDGNKGTANVTLHVLAPEAQKTVTVWQDDPTPSAESVITNSGDINSKLPGTTYTWQDTPSTATPGSFPATIITHWTDGKTTTSQTTIVVKKLHDQVTTGEGTEKTFSRGIYTQLEGQDEPTKVDTQSVILQRTGTKNNKTGEIVWDAWQPKQMDAYKAPSYTNYTVVNPDAGKAIMVDGSVDKLPDVVFQYKANHETIDSGADSQMNVSRDVFKNVDGVLSVVARQSITLHRTGDKNMVSGEITWNDWQPATLTKVNAPDVAGYTVQNPDAAPEVVLHGNKNAKDVKLDNVIFEYTANAQKQVVNYVDINDNTHIVGTDNINGKTNETVAYTAQAPTNWVIVPGQQIPSSITFGTKEAAPINILVEHGHKFDQDGDHKTVIRDVVAINPENGNTETVQNQKAILTRSTNTDLVTGEVTYGQWNTKSFKAVNAPEFKGYTVINPNDARAVVVNGDTQNSTVTFRYAANYFNQQINYVDKTNNQVVSTDNVGGQTNSTVVYDVKVPVNYKLAEGEPSQITVKFGNVAPTEAKTIYVVEGTAPVYNDTQKTVTRAIYTQLEGQDKTLYQNQSVQLTRTGERNLVTGKVTYTDWQPVTMGKFDAPEYENYTVQNPDAAPAVTVDGSVDKLAPVTFIYKANHQSITEGEGTAMAVTRDIYTNVDGTVTKVDVQSETLHRTGDKNMATGEITWNPWETKNMSVYPAPVIKDHTVINPDAAPAVILDGSVDKLADVVFNYKDNHETITEGEGTEKTVTRDVYTSLDGIKSDKPAYTQSVTLHRTGDKNVVTGEIKWNAWEPKTIEKAVAPKVDNYTVTNPDAGPAVTVDGLVDKLADVVFTYKANHETITTGEGTTMNITRDIYTNVDGTVTKVDTQIEDLHRTGDKNMATGEIKWNAWEPKTMSAYKAPEIKDHTVINPDAAPAVTLDGSVDKLADVVFNYKDNHETITTGEGTEKTITRDVYTSLDGVKSDDPAYTQSVTLHRTGDKNVVTGEIKWSDWTTGTIEKAVAPKVDNYTVTNPDAGPAVTVDGSVDKLTDVVFNYKSNTQVITDGEGTEKNVTRDIYTDVNGEKKYADTQTVTLHRTGVKNVVTGEIKWNAWKPRTVETYNAPSIPGYVVTNPEAGASVVADGSVDKLADVVFNYILKYHVSVPAGEKVTTHVGANENVPSLDPANVNLSWTDKDGKIIDKPVGVTVTWANVPNTSSITDETGTLKITYADGYTTTLDIPVTVQGATAGDIQKVYQNDVAPAAKTTVNISTVDHFGITDVTWKNTPSTAVPGANIPGIATVHYSDGTTQDVDVSLDVIGVEDGRDHKDNGKLYRTVKITSKITDAYGVVSYIKVDKHFYKIRYTDYAYPVGDSRRETYTKWTEIA
ncbi:Rib/alpha-like domain-containing protein [uncultured Lactobacillus sp.]|uniref:mucin-binding protein n=1 Tax=uncultured Lactobacillus sp. TaxID=153152 RepID=UPI00261035F4|nr:Rib/alpha-like domain-containing protein [uncultured Lactobacillus sp.]